MNGALLGSCDCRTAKQDQQPLSFSRSVDSVNAAAYLASIVDELKSEDYNEDALPFFQRIAVSGEEMSGVSASVVIFMRFCWSKLL